MILQIIGHT